MVCGDGGWFGVSGVSGVGDGGGLVCGGYSVGGSVWCLGGCLFRSVCIGSVCDSVCGLVVGVSV